MTNTGDALVRAKRDSTAVMVSCGFPAILITTFPVQILLSAIGILNVS